jgi:hypothetical protein
MTPAKEKAKELVDKFISHTNSDWDLCDIIQSQQCALIAVDEIITAIENVFTKSVAKLNSTYRYYQEVKTEIEKL